MKNYIDKLKIRDVKHLAKLLKTSTEELYKLRDIISSEPERYYTQWEKKIKKGKIRPMVKIHGRLREILDVLKKLLQRIRMPSYVHGGVRGKSTITNARPHTGKPMLVRIDLEKHFPSTSHHKVYAMFRIQQECSPEVARILTRLTTLNSGLPQGSPTSTLISNLVTLSLSNRLYNFAISRGGKCTQYVDDYTFSGDRKLSRYADKIAEIVAQEGFKTNPTKTDTMPATNEQVTTGIRVNGNKLDIPSSQVKEIRCGLESLQGELEVGKNLSQRAIRRFEGKIRYVSQFNPGAAKPLKRKLNHLKSINH